MHTPCTRRAHAARYAAQHADQHAAHLKVSVVAEADAGAIRQGRDRVASAASRRDHGRCKGAEQSRLRAAWTLLRLAEPELTAAVVAQPHQLALLAHLHGTGGGDIGDHRQEHRPYSRLSSAFTRRGLSSRAQRGSLELASDSEAAGGRVVCCKPGHFGHAASR